MSSKRNDHGGEQAAAEARRVTEAQKRVIKAGKREVYERAKRAGFTEKEARRFAGL